MSGSYNQTVIISTLTLLFLLIISSSYLAMATNQSTFNATQLNAPSISASVNTQQIPGPSTQCDKSYHMVMGYSANVLLHLSNSSQSNVNFSSMNSLNASQLSNITDLYGCSIASNMPIKITNYNLTIPYGELKQNGAYPKAGTALHFATYTNGTNTISSYNISIEKAVPELIIKNGRVKLGY